MGKVEEAQEILETLGMPKAQCNEISALTLLALCNIKESDSWKKAKRESLTVSKGIMIFTKNYYNKEYAPNTRETFRRQVLHQFVQGLIADYNPDEPDLPTNSPRVHYAITKAALKVVRAFGTDKFKTVVKRFNKNYGSLLGAYQKDRKKQIVPVTLPNGKKVELSPGKHNKLQAEIIANFASRFIEKPVVVYLGDTAEKVLHFDKKFFEDNKVDISDHGKLPDVVIHDKKRNWIFLIEAVTSHGPMNPKRIFELEKMFCKCPIGKVFVSSFLDFAEFKKHSKDISWETEVWIAESPDHMIHFNGDKFLGPR
jgi:type II restriction enzyme